MQEPQECIVLHLRSSEEEAGAFLKCLEIRTRNLLQKYWPIVDVLSKELLTRDSIEGKEVARLLDARISGVSLTV